MILVIAYIFVSAIIGIVAIMSGSYNKWEGEYDFAGTVFGIICIGIAMMVSYYVGQQIVIQLYN